MKKKYFTGLIPASDLDSKYKRLQIDSTISITFPPIAPLQYYENPLLKDDFHLDIDIIPEFKTGSLLKKDKLWVVELPKSVLTNYFPLTEFHIILGVDEDSSWTPPDIGSDTIRNWTLGFFELIEWDEDHLLHNFELTLLWKIKKRKPKG